MVAFNPSGRGEGRFGLRRYIRKAVRIPWNLLAFIGGLVGAALSPWPDALMPLVVAGELAFIGGLVSIKKFRDAVDAEEAAKLRGQGAPGQLPESALTEMLASLPREAQLRFQSLRQRCLRMQQLAAGARGKNPRLADPTDDMNTGSLDRLLWSSLMALSVSVMLWAA